MAGWYEIIENPKNIEEWFHNRDVEERRKHQGAFIASMSAIMKEAYSDLLIAVENDGYGQNPFLAKITKK